MTEIEGLRVPCEIYSRVVGYIRPIQSWNQGKVQEHRDRVAYQMVIPSAKEMVAKGHGIQITTETEIVDDVQKVFDFFLDTEEVEEKEGEDQDFYVDVNLGTIHKGSGPERPVPDYRPQRDDDEV